MVWPLGLKNPGLTNRGMTTGVTEFRMASGELKIGCGNTGTLILVAHAA